MIFWLLIIPIHFVKDYYLQTNAMYEGKRQATGYLPQLACHSAVNALGTMFVVWITLLDTEPVAGAVVALAAGLFDFGAHLAIDRAKFLFDLSTVTDQSLHCATYLTIYVALSLI